MKFIKLVFLIVVCIKQPLSYSNNETIVVGSKIFTESVILGEMISILLEEKYNYKVKRNLNLGSTQYVFSALKTHEIDIYPEYTGTAYAAILHLEKKLTAKKTYRTVKASFAKKFKMAWSKPLGFDNTYAIAVRSDDPNFNNINSISGLVEKKLTSLVVDHSFLERTDGYKQLAKNYNISLPANKLVSMDPGLMYAALKNKQTDAIVAYSTDGRIKAYNLKLLEDDKKFFPVYEAAYLTTKSTLKKFPKIKMAFKDLEGNISPKEMIELNSLVDHLKQEAYPVAKNFLIQKKLIAGSVEAVKHKNIFSYYYNKKNYFFGIFIEHLILTFVSIFFATLFAIPIGILMARKKIVAKTLFPIINTLNTIPSLALLGILIPLLGIGYAPAIFALFIYSLLPITRNTYEGIKNVDINYIEVATGIGLTKFQILKKIEWPLSLPVIIAGIRTSAVIVVGTATLAALIGAGGLGEPIFRGIATMNFKLIFLGAIPAALLAVIIDRSLSLLENLVISKGLKLKKGY